MRRVRIVAVLAALVTFATGCRGSYQEPPLDTSQTIEHKLLFPLATPRTPFTVVRELPRPTSQRIAADQLTATTHAVMKIWAWHFMEQLRLQAPYAEVHALRKAEPSEQEPVYGETLCDLDLRGDSRQLGPHSLLRSPYCPIDSNNQGTIWYGIGQRCCTDLFKTDDEFIRAFRQVLVAGFAVGHDLSYELYKLANVPLPEDDSAIAHMAACYTGILLTAVYPPTNTFDALAYIQDEDNPLFDVDSYRQALAHGWNARAMSGCIAEYSQAA